MLAEGASRGPGGEVGWGMRGHARLCRDGWLCRELPAESAVHKDPVARTVGVSPPIQSLGGGRKCLTSVPTSCDARGAVKLCLANNRVKQMACESSRSMILREQDTCHLLGATRCTSAAHACKCEDKGQKETTVRKQQKQTQGQTFATLHRN